MTHNYSLMYTWRAILLRGLPLCRVNKHYNTVPLLRRRRSRIHGAPVAVPSWRTGRTVDCPDDGVWQWVRTRTRVVLPHYAPRCRLLCTTVAPEPPCYSHAHSSFLSNCWISWNKNLSPFVIIARLRANQGQYDTIEELKTKWTGKLSVIRLI